MSRKRKAPVRKVYPDPRFHSEVVSKFINSIMYDGKRSTAEKILYDALDIIKTKNNEDKSRYSIPFFLHPRPEVILDPETNLTANDFLNKRLSDIKLG